MAKSDRTKVTDSSGKVTVIKREERYPHSTELLMCNGFPIILLNMVFGLLPTTLFGSRLKYYRCSVAQAYAFVFGLCMIILTFFFIPMSMMTVDNPGRGTTDTVVLLLGTLTHVCGFLFILIRGYYVARKMPVVWSQMSKLIHISVVELHGNKYHGLKKLRRFSQYAISTLLLSMILNGINVFIQELDKMLPSFFLYYNLQFIEVTELNYITINISYILWKLCSYSHILVSVMAGFLVVGITVCLQAGNDHLLAIFEDDKNLLRIKNREKIIRLKERHDQELNDEDANILKALNQVKDIHVVAENVIGSISKIFGVSLIVEVLILISNLLVDIFYVLVPITSTSDDVENGNFSTLLYMISSDNNDTSSAIYRRFFRNYVNEEDIVGIDEEKISNLPISFDFFDGNLLTLLGEAFVHSYFFYKLCCKTTEMANEAKEPLQILKTVPYSNFSKKVQHQISILKGDLATNSITLTASNFFQINKFTLTSVTSALTTYIIVLLQFSQQEQGKRNENS